MKSAITILFLLTVSFANSQTIKNARPYADVISADSLKKKLYIIAGAGMQGRETATKGQLLAAEYIQRQFKNAGLSGGWRGQFQQPFEVLQDSIVTNAITINHLPLRNNKDFIVSSSTANVSLETNEILFIGYGTSDSSRNDYKNINAQGKIVMVTPGTLKLKTNSQKKQADRFDFYAALIAAKEHGALAVLVEGKNFPRPPLSSKGRKYVTEEVEPMPAVFIISEKTTKKILGKKYAVLKRSLKVGRPVSQSISLPIKLELKKVHFVTESTNVIGYIEGTDKKNEALVISAHYDHEGMKDSLIYYGADDDGSGTVTVMELARAFGAAVKDSMRPRRTIIFMALSGEEQGLWGSSYYSQNPAFPLEKTSADINIDMIGRTEDERLEHNYIYVIGDDKLSSELRKVNENANDSSAMLKLDYKYNAPNDPQRIYYRSDHYNFAKKGVPVIFYFSGFHKDYHQPTDTPDKINYELLQKRATLIFNTAWEIANRDEMLKRDLPL